MGLLLNKPYPEAGKFRWHAAIGLAMFHIMALLAATLYRGEWWEDTALIRTQCVLMVCIGISNTAGAHRCFVHQAYESALPLQIVYMIFVVSSLTGSPVGWIKSHRTHHKYSDTAMDPHNSHLGFWHSHFGWLCWEPSKAINAEREKQETGTLQYEWLHLFVHRIYDPAGVVMAFALPYAALSLVGAAVNWWGLFWTTWIRLAVGLNMAASVNSLAHTFGSRPYNSYIEARNNFFVSVFTWGEGWHNYHHAFPKDFRASAHDNFVLYWNPAHAWILLMAYLGLAYNLKVGCEEKDPEKAISELKKAAVFSKITRIVFGFASCPTRMYRFEQVGGFHYKYRFKRATADKQKIDTADTNVGQKAEQTNVSGDPTPLASIKQEPKKVL